MLEREVYLEAPGNSAALWLHVSYLDDKGTRQEVMSTSGASDTYLNWKRRMSCDNGRTWNDTEPLDGVVQNLSLIHI